MQSPRQAVKAIALGAMALSVAVGSSIIGIVDAQAVTSRGENIVERPAGTLTADALPTVQINNGVVWDQAIVGNTVFAGGEFAHARPAGAAVDTQLMPRANLLAYDITTGVATSWAPKANGGVMALALSPDKSRLYVGGKFTTIDGVARSRIVAFDTVTGAMVPDFAPVVDGEVSAIEATNTTVYLGGFFASVNGVARTRLAAVDTHGSLTAWAPTADSYVRGMALTNDGSRLVIGGSFSTINGATDYGVASLDPTTGALQPLGATSVITNHGDNAGLYSVRNNGTSIMVTGWSYSGTGRFEGVASLDESTGSLRWMADCHGDSYDTASLGGVVYSASHHHNCENISYEPEQPTRIYQRLDGWLDKATTTVKPNIQTTYDSFAGQPAPSAISWWPSLGTGAYTGQLQGAWSLATDGRYMVAGGEFPTVNNVNQYGLTRFAVDTIAPKKMGPRYNGTAVRSTVVGSTVRLAWQANTDWDGTGLKYDVYRLQTGGSKELVGSLQQDATWWDRPMLTMVDKGAKPSTTYQYWARATDADGNTKDTSWVTVTTGEGRGETPAVASVFNDGATHYWRMGDATGAAVLDDQLTTAPLTASTGVTAGVAGAVAGSTDTAVDLNGTSTGFATAKAAENNTPAVSVETWVKTTSTAGGKLIGFGSSTGTASSVVDRQLYMTTSGQLAWGVYNGTKKAIGSTKSLNDGQWHHVVGTLGSDGMKLYVDGVLNSSNAAVTASTVFSGYWHLGCDSLTGWPSAPYTKCLKATVDETSVYPKALTAGQVAAHFAAAQPGANKAPVAAFTATAAADGTIALDASTSSDADGTLAGYAWDFGDGTTGTGVRTSHAYTKSGTYSVALTVTDDAGAKTTSTQPVTVTIANKAPVAKATVTCTGLTCTADATGSTDADGTVASHAWDFGDGSTGTGATASHDYAATGSYTVTLTVTDDAGVTTSTSQQVLAQAADSTAKLVASDTFGTTRTRWGSAEVGGAYTYGSASTFTTNGSTGLVAAAKGVTSRATLAAVSARDVSTTVDVQVDQLTTGGGLYTRVESRVANNNAYWASGRLNANGTMTMTISRLVAGVQTDLRSVTPPGTYAPGQALRIRFDVTGDTTTTLAASMWPAGTAAPTTPQLTTTDATAALQTAGAVGLSTYLSGTATTGVGVAFDNLSVTASA